MRKQDITFLAVNFIAMFAGVMMPFLAQPLLWVPRAALLTLFLVSFLAIDCGEAWNNVKAFPGAALLLTVIKLLVMPVVCWFVFLLVLPEFALGAALMGGASSAVAGPFLALMMQADFVLVLVGLVISSLLLPLTLPFLLSLLPGAVGAAAFPVWDMTLSLAMTITIPFCVAQCARRAAPALTATVLRQRMPIFLACMGFSTIAIFSRYSSVLLESPEYMLKAVGVACLLCLVIFCISSALTWWMPPDKQMAVVISCVSMNNILMLILSLEFFSVSEVLLAALYAVPFFGAIFPYRLLHRIRGGGEAGGKA